MNVPTVGITIDLDGTVYTGSSLLPGVRQALEALGSAGVPHVFVTNNSRSRNAVSQLLQDVGLAISPNQIVTASSLVAEFIVDKAWNNHPVICLGGGRGLPSELKSVGLHTIALRDTHVDSNVTVAIGWRRSLRISELARLLALSPNIQGLVATDADRVYAASDGMLLPGTGWIVGAVENLLSNRVTICGKPSDSVLPTIARRLGVPLDRLYSIGDSPDTDAMPALVGPVASRPPASRVGGPKRIRICEGLL